MVHNSGERSREIAKSHPPSLQAQRSNPFLRTHDDGLLRCARSDADGPAANQREKPASHTTKSRGAIPHQSGIPIRRSGIEIIRPHPPNFFAGRPGIAVRMTYFRRTENIHLSSTGAVD